MAQLKPVDNDPFAPTEHPGIPSIPFARLSTDDLLTQGPGVYHHGDDPVRELSAQRHNPVNAGELAIGLVGGPRLMGRTSGIRAFHGSPHDFEKFDTAKIGTGEGAQAYGHGLYFAENEGVARSYRDALARGPAPGDDWARYALDEHKNSNSAIQFLKDQLHEHKQFAVGGTRAEIPNLENAIYNLEQGYAINAPGRMYEVNIGAKPEQFLDWDKPVAAQPKAVLDIASNMNFPQKADRGFDLTGGNLYRDMSRRAGGERPMAGGSYTAPYTDDGAASKALREAGIPGIRYLDQGSRPAANLQAQLAKDLATYERAGNKTAVESIKQQLANPPNTSSNYVIFDPGIIDIIRKYGLAGLSALPPTTAAFLSDRIKPVDHDPFAKEPSL